MTMRPGVGDRALMRKKDDNDTFETIFQEIVDDEMNSDMIARGYLPLYAAHSDAKIVIVGQAPGTRAQASMKPWNDASGDTLRRWMGVSEEEFYNPAYFAHIPMDFFYPGKGKSGDLPPRKGFAAKWHPRLLALMPSVELVILIGAYSQKYYLGKDAKANLTETVRAYYEYYPNYFPVVHPSPLNFRWKIKNGWFEEVVVPELNERVRAILNTKE